MTIIAVAGDAATTTSVAISAVWPPSDSALLLEADPTGGSLTGWLGTAPSPSLATLIATVGNDARACADTAAVLSTVAEMTHHSDAGVQFIANAVRARAASRAVNEAATVLLPVLAAAASTVIADVGVHRSGHAPSPALAAADVAVIVHRQSAASAAATAVRIERLVEVVEELAHLDATVMLALVGRDPFDPEEIAAFVTQSVPDVVHHTVTLAEDPLAAAVIAGRSGVSTKRLHRLPLMRDAARLANELFNLTAIGATA